MKKKKDGKPDGRAKNGGSGRGQGRKAIDDKKVTITVYPRQSQIDALGGKDAARAAALAAIETPVKNI